MNARTDHHTLATPDVYFATLPSGVRLPYVLRGAGEPLLFVHGSLCDYRYWNAQAAALSQRYQCISVSLSHYWPGAETDLPAPFSWWSHVAELAEFVGALNIGPVHLVGHSRGGCIAFQLAHEYPHLVKTLTLADPGGPLQADGMDEAPPAPVDSANEALRARAAALIEAGDVEAGLELFVDAVSMPGIWRKSPPGFRAMAIDNAATLPKQFRDPLPAYTRAAAESIACPTLLIAGAKSPRVYRDNADALARWIGGAQQNTVAGASHGMNVTHAGEFNRVLAAFVATAAA